MVKYWGNKSEKALKTYHGVISSGREYNSMQNQSVQSSLVPGLPGNLLRRLVDGGLYAERDHLIK